MKLTWNEWYRMVDGAMFHIYGVRASSTQHEWRTWYREGFTPREALLEARDRGLFERVWK